MFGFIIKYLGFLKNVPPLALVFENLLILHTLLTRPYLLDFFDEIKAEVCTWPGVSVTIHKYGGMQFNCARTELGHVHGNGLLDIRFSRKEKEHIIAGGRATRHQIFEDSGWISFYIRSAEDKRYAVSLLYQCYLKKKNVSTIK